jgi:hypothetical protein
MKMQEFKGTNRLGGNGKMKAKNKNSSSQTQITKAWEKTERNKQRRHFITSIIILVTLVMTSGFSVTSALPTHSTASRPLSTLCLGQYRIGFRELRIGESQRIRLVIENCGSTPLTFQRTTITGADASEFAADNPAGAVLQGHEKCYIIATFEPKARRNGRRNGQLNIYSSSDQASVLMSGTAKIPDGYGSKRQPLAQLDDIPPCKPPKPYALVCLVNQTGWSINYSYKWGERDWESRTVNANSSRWHSWEYAPGSHSSPNFTIRFDASFTSSTDYKNYDLKRYQASEKTCWAGKVYEFKEVGRNAIELYDSGN